MSQQTIQLQIPDNTQLLQLYGADCFDRGLDKETVRHYTAYVKRFLSYLEERGLTVGKVDKVVLRDYIRIRRNGVDEKTLQKEFAGISGLFEYLVFEDYILKNPIPGVRRRYLRTYKKEAEADVESPRKLITIEHMSMLINSIVDTRDKAILTLFAKTGLRRGELISLNVTDVNWSEQSLTLQKKQFKKRSGRTVFFDEETARVLKRWLEQREDLHPETAALFVGERGGRLKRHGIYEMTVKYATAVGLHDPNSSRPEDHLTPHCFRHWFTTHLRRAGMDREFIKILRGDRRRDAISIYDRVDAVELKRAYLAYIPQLGL